ncbi:hypothetical protein STFR1_30193 [Bacillus vallismortis]
MFLLEDSILYIVLVMRDSYFLIGRDKTWYKSYLIRKQGMFSGL